MTEQDYLDIEAYLQGELAPDRAAALEARAAADPALAAALAERRLLNDHLRAAGGEEALRATLQPLGERYFTGEEDTDRAPAGATVRPLPARGGALRWVAGLAAAAAVALLLVFGAGLLDNDDPYRQFAQHQPLSLTERGEGDNGISAAEDAYNSGRYAEAVPALTDYLDNNPDDDRARLALGVSLLEEGDNAGAVAALTQLAEGDGTLAPYGNWYLALAALRRDDKTEATRRLDRIPAGDPYLDGRVADLREVLRYN